LSPLEKTLASIRVKEVDNLAVNETTTFFGGWLTVNLKSRVLDAVFDIPSATSDAVKGRGLIPFSEVSSLVHETTHAFLLSNADAEVLLKNAVEYYADAQLEGGGTVGDAALAAQEAAATYVAAQVVDLLIVHNDLTLAEQGIASGSSYGRASAVEKVESALVRLDSSKSAKARSFGYDFVGGKQRDIDKVIMPELANFLDTRVLSGLSAARVQLETRAENLRRVHGLGTK